MPVRSTIDGQSRTTIAFQTYTAQLCPSRFTSTDQGASSDRSGNADSAADADGAGDADGAASLAVGPSLGALSAELQLATTVASAAANAQVAALEKASQGLRSSIADARRDKKLARHTKRRAKALMRGAKEKAAAAVKKIADVGARLQATELALSTARDVAAKLAAATTAATAAQSVVLK